MDCATQILPLYEYVLEEGNSSMNNVPNIEFASVHIYAQSGTQ